MDPMFFQLLFSGFELRIIMERQKLIFILVFQEGNFLPLDAIGKLRPRFLTFNHRESERNDLFDIKSIPQVDSHRINSTNSYIFMTKCSSMLNLINFLSLNSS